GLSEGAILSLLYWLNRTPDPGPSLTPVTHLWVATTEKGRRKCVSELLRELRTHFKDVRFRVRTLSGLEDIATDIDHGVMSEVLFRFHLEAEAWQKRAPEGTTRCVSVGLSGGRKTTSAAL